MNILPIALVFLAILTTLSYNFLKEAATLSQEKNLCLGYLEAERLLTSSLYQIAYEKAKEKNQEKKVEKSPKKEGSKKDKRQKKFSKMNLYPLFSTNSSPLLKEIFEKLLKTLYASHPAFDILNDQEQMHIFIDSIITSGKEIIKNHAELSSITLFNLYPQDPTYAFVFYKMLKGTHLYQLKDSSHPKAIGYPPLNDYFFIKEDTNPKLFSFSTLSTSLLEIVFDPKIAKAILDKEQELSDKNPEGKTVTLTKEELLSLIHQQFPSHKDLDSFIEHLDFHTKKLKNSTIKVIDPKTHITLEKIPTNPS